MSYLTQLTKHYGVTKNPLKGGFLLPNGWFLDFSEGSSERSQDHRNIVWVSRVPEKDRESRWDVLVRIATKVGMYRWMPENWALESWTPPTKAQLEIVAELAYYRPMILECNAPKRHFYREYNDNEYRKVQQDLIAFYR